VSDRPTAPLSVTLGFLTVFQEPSGWLGGYLVTNAWGRPLEFRLSTAVQPNKVQSALYGPTLTEYLHADLIGKTLVEKTTAKPDLIVADAVAAVGLRTRVGIPTVAFRPESEFLPSDCRTLSHPRSAVSLVIGSKFAADEATVLRILDAVDPAVELTEPFARIREAVAEARKMGVTNRAA
jgi:hypothetical protein